VERDRSQQGGEKEEARCANIKQTIDEAPQVLFILEEYGVH